MMHTGLGIQIDLAGVAWRATDRPGSPWCLLARATAGGRGRPRARRR
ncbi:MAG: hypothetical protein R3E96_16145 [Planctomycetota bacterium]